MASDDQFFERALGRINTSMLVLMTAGTAAAAWIGGWRGLVGFFLGASVSYFYFRWIKQVVDALAPGTKPPRKRVIALLMLRYAIFGVAGYYLVKYLGINLMAALAGLSVSVAAVMVELVYELVFCKF